MTKTFILFYLTAQFSFAQVVEPNETDYSKYHLKVIEAEEQIVATKYEDALATYEQLFERYAFVFLREYQVATQLALLNNRQQLAKSFLRKGILHGWNLKSIKRNTYLSKLIEGSEGKTLKKEYSTLRKQYEVKLNHPLREEVKKMFSKDQWKAFKALFRLSSKAQDRYAEKRFAPHSELQLTQLSEILRKYGYPGEKLIGNRWWMSTILSHHNSISAAYNKTDSLYPNLWPKLIKALKKGEITPYELATIDDWYRSTKDQRQKPTYGILAPPTSTNLAATNALRKKIHMRPYELRTSLIAIQEKTGINLYLPDLWY